MISIKVSNFNGEQSFALELLIKNDLIKTRALSIVNSYIEKEKLGSQTRNFYENVKTSIEVANIEIERLN